MTKQSKEWDDKLTKSYIAYKKLEDHYKIRPADYMCVEYVNWLDAHKKLQKIKCNAEIELINFLYERLEESTKLQEILK